MGAALGAVYDALWQEMTGLCWNWSEYEELYGTKKSRIDLLNKAAAHYFGAMQAMGWEHTLLHLARLTDPPRSAGKENLTINRLPSLLQSDDVRAKIELLISDAIEKTKFARDWRNRRLAHTDLGLAIDDSANPLTEGGRQSVNESLRAITFVLNFVATQYELPETHFDGASPPEGAIKLLSVLADGVWTQEDHFERIESGNIDERDYKWLERKRNL